MEDYLGRGWKGENLFNPIAEDVTYPIIDMEKLLRDHPSYFSDKSINLGEANSFAYASFDRYEEKSNITNKVSSGLSLNLGLFSIGSKKTMSEVFTSTVVNESQSVFGELNVLYKANQYTLQTSSNILENIRSKYLFPEFKEELYNTSPSELFQNYGGFVLRDFFTGGRAIALYTGKYKSSSTESGKESDMNKDINASYGFDVNGSSSNVSGELGIGKKYSNGTASSGKFNSVSVSVKTLGGSPAYATFNSPQNLDNVNINLSSWLSSLSDKNKHAIIDVAKNGLIPITEFIPEDNLRKKIEGYYETGVSSVESLQEPYWLLVTAYNQKPPITIGIELIDKYGDKNYVGVVTLHNADLEEYLPQLSARLQKICDLKVVDRINRSNTQNNPPYERFYIDFKNAKKVVDTNDGTIYIICKNSRVSTLFAFTVHGDKVIRDYAMQKYIDSLPTANVSIQELLDSYTLHAL